MVGVAFGQVIYFIITFFSIEKIIIEEFTHSKFGGLIRTEITAIKTLSVALKIMCHIFPI